MNFLKLLNFLSIIPVRIHVDWNQKALPERQVIFNWVVVQIYKQYSRVKTILHGNFH